MAGDSVQPKETSLLARETTVLGGAVVDLLGDTYNKLPSLPSKADVSQKMAEVVRHPLDSTWNGLCAAGNGIYAAGSYTWQNAGTYISNHKMDAVVGAAIAFAGPKGLWHAGLLLWSSHGLIEATGSAGLKAYSPDADLAAARRQFKNDLEHEGQTFLSSLPMTMAGGVVGRGFANALFGRNMSFSNFDLKDGIKSGKEAWKTWRYGPQTALSPELGYNFHYGRISFSPHPYNPNIRKATFVPHAEFEAKARADFATTGKIDFRQPIAEGAGDPKVSVYKVLSNLDAWRMKKLLIHDLDNAAYKFPEGYLGRKVATEDVPGEGIEKAIAMIQERLAAREVVVTHKDVAAKLGATMEANRTHDGAWQVQQSPIRKMFPGTSAEFESEIVKPFWEIIDKSRDNYLTAFDKAHEVKAEYVRKGGRIAGLSDAPLGVSLHGLRVTELDTHHHFLLSMEALEPKPGAVCETALESGRSRVRHLLNARTKLRQITELPRHEDDPLFNLEKPHPAGIDIAIADAGVRPSQAIMFDDSRVKGGGAAENASGGPVDFVYFEGQKNAFEPVHKILKPEAPTVSSAAPKAEYPPHKVSIHNYEELRESLYPQYGKLVWSVLQRPSWSTALGFKPAEDSRKAFDLLYKNLTGNDQ